MVRDHRARCHEFVFHTRLCSRLAIDLIGLVGPRAASSRRPSPARPCRPLTPPLLLQLAALLVWTPAQGFGWPAGEPSAGHYCMTSSRVVLWKQAGSESHTLSSSREKHCRIHQPSCCHRVIPGVACEQGHESCAPSFPPCPCAPLLTLTSLFAAGASASALVTSCRAHAPGPR